MFIVCLYHVYTMFIGLYPAPSKNLDAIREWDQKVLFQGSEAAEKTPMDHNALLLLLKTRPNTFPAKQLRRYLDPAKASYPLIKFAQDTPEWNDYEKANCPHGIYGALHMVKRRFDEVFPKMWARCSAFCTVVCLYLVYSVFIVCL